MKKILMSIVIALSFTSSIISANGLVPIAPGLSRPTPVDAVFFGENRIVAGDRSYGLADSLVVHAPNTPNASVARVRAGVVIGFRVGSGGLIEEIWLLSGSVKPGTDYRY